MLPGKTYTIDDYLSILWRRKWLVIVPLILVGTTTAVVTWRLPNQYRATAVIEVAPQRVPSEYVQATVTSSPTERLASLREQVMSRTRLEQIILEFNLYPDLRRAGIMEDVIERMRREIGLDIPTGRGARSESTSFTISYVGANAQVVTRVTERLTSVVIDENLKDRARAGLEARGAPRVGDQLRVAGAVGHALVVRLRWRRGLSDDRRRRDVGALDPRGDRGADVVLDRLQLRAWRGSTNVIARPERPTRPVRPMRCT